MMWYDDVVSRRSSTLLWLSREHSTPLVYSTSPSANVTVSGVSIHAIFLGRRKSSFHPGAIVNCSLDSLVATLMIPSRDKLRMLEKGGFAARLQKAIIKRGPLFLA